MTPWLTICLNLALALLAIAFAFTGWRFFRGPSVLDRILAFDVTAVTAIGLLVVLAIRGDVEDHIELILVYALLGFSATATFTVYLIRSDAAEHEVTGREVNESDEP